MHRSQIRPLKTLALKSRPLTSHALSWSCDAELAVATDDAVHIFIPEYPRPDVDEDSAPQDSYRHQFSLSIHATGIFAPHASVNAQLCSDAGVKLPPPGGADTDSNTGTDEKPEPPWRQVTSKGASVSQVVRVEWSPNGLGANHRPVLAAMVTNGELLMLGEQSDPRSSGLRSRTTRTWKILWALGAGMPIPAEHRAGSYRTVDDRITSFSWARELFPGRALLAYATDEGEVAVMSVQYSSRYHAWRVREVARFDAGGPHEVIDCRDPDFVPSGTAFSLQWSPWVVEGGSRTANLAFIARNYVGFRKVSIRGICVNLSVDAFVQWEDMIYDDDDDDHAKTARGVICTPFLLQPFQVDILGPPRPPVMVHHTDECSTTYSDYSPTNPISGLVVYRPPANEKPPYPLYAAVRASATAESRDWFETNAPQGEDSGAVPRWVWRIKDSIERLVPRMEALDVPGADSDSEDSEDEPEDTNGAGSSVYQYRFRFWGLALSPGGSSTIALVSKHSTQFPTRQASCKVLFDKRPENPNPTREGNEADGRLSTEGKMWEWMYGDGAQIPGVTVPSSTISSDTVSPLREIFADLRTKQTCAFCSEGMRNDGTEARCSKNHVFATCTSSGLAILAPGVSRICSVCQKRRLSESELRKLAAEHVGPDTILPDAAELCGSCGAKFVT